MAFSVGVLVYDILHTLVGNRGRATTKILMLGYPAKHMRHPVFRPLFDLLAKQGHKPEICNNDEFVVKSVEAADIVILKTYHHDPRVIAKAREFEAAGKRVINSTLAIYAVADRVRTDEMLEAACLPVPPRVVTKNKTNRVLPPYVQKPRNNFLHKISFVQNVADLCFDVGFYYQQLVPNDGIDRKLYVIGTQVFLITRPSTHVQNFERKLREKRMCLSPPEQWRAWATKIGELTGLEVYGVDLVGQDDAFYIIDVNPFPGFMGVVDAPILLARLILQ
ncbi:MAG: RimK domain-containing protein [Promethearchaeota archaeon CR_4]|nr:MAG: RimK domain-containing protein [Candidatus Lokiarchaeota archaeon CR_4]